MELSLDEPQAVLVRELLDRDLRDLRFEIADTDNSTYKAELREREDLLRSVLAQLGGPLPNV